MESLAFERLSGNSKTRCFGAVLDCIFTSQNIILNKNYDTMFIVSNGNYKRKLKFLTPLSRR